MTAILALVGAGVVVALVVFGAYSAFTSFTIKRKRK